MSIVFSLLLLAIFALIFWVFRSHKNAAARALVIALFFSFCVIFGASFDSIMGWAAKDKYLPDIVTIQQVVIQEPNASTGQPGGIFLLINHPPTSEDMFLKVFGYSIDYPEPRLFKLPYSKGLHEQMQKIMGRLVNGQTVTGKLGKPGEGEGEGEGKEGMDGNRPGSYEGEGEEEGDGSESLNSGFQFHELPPSYFLKKE